MTARLSSDADANLKENKQQETVLNIEPMLMWTLFNINVLGLEILHTSFCTVFVM